MRSQPEAPVSTHARDDRGSAKTVSQQRAIIIDAIASALVEAYLEDQAKSEAPGDSPSGRVRKPRRAA